MSRKKDARLKWLQESFDILSVDPNISEEELKKAIKKEKESRAIAKSYKNAYTPVRTGGGIYIGEFKPTPKEVVIDGKKYYDLGEFYGVTEYGGECYRKQRFTIPKGRTIIEGE